MRFFLSLGVFLAACNFQVAEPVAYTDPSAAQYVAALKAARANPQTCVNNAAGVGYPTGSTGYSAVPADPLAWDGQVGEVARQRAAYLAASGVLTHSEGHTAFAAASRLQTNGYRYLKVGENLGSGQTSAQQVIRAWLASTNGHCNALMDADFNHVGLVKNGQYWVLVLAKPN